MPKGSSTSRHSDLSAVITTEIAHWMTYVSPATVTTYKGVEFVPPDNSVMQLPARA